LLKRGLFSPFTHPLLPLFVKIFSFFEKKTVENLDICGNIGKFAHKT